MTSGYVRIASLWRFALLAFVMALMGAWSLRVGSDADCLIGSLPFRCSPRPYISLLFALLMISMRDLGLRGSTIHAKLFNAITNLAAFLMVTTSDLVIFSAVAIMIPVRILGALLGTCAILGRGIVLIRP